jgi:hypothetical protein
MHVRTFPGLCRSTQKEIKLPMIGSPIELPQLRFEHTEPNGFR